MKMKNLFFAFIMVMFVSCISNLEKGKVITLADYSTLIEDKNNDNLRFSFIGYPNIDDDITIGFNKPVYFSVYSKPAGQGDLIMAQVLPIGYGKGKNKFTVPKEFTMEDLVIYDNEGNALSYDTKMQFSFTLDLQTNRERSKQGDRLVYFHTLGKVRIDKAE
jgi:hypothetical protein